MKCTKCGSPSGRRKFKRLTVRGKPLPASAMYQIIDIGDFPAQTSTVPIVIAVIAVIFILAFAVYGAVHLVLP